MTYFVCCSGGNDSIALVQFMIENGEPFHVVYNNTGWAVDWWSERMEKVRLWVEASGNIYHETRCEGMKALIKRKGGWPMPASAQQFCTQYLKKEPSAKYYDTIDPEKDFDVVTGRRRDESQNRRDLPEWGADPAHGGRETWNPLYAHNAWMRDELLLRSPFDRINTQSLECYPCINANKSSTVLRELPENRIKEIEDFELSLGKNRKMNCRTMFRPSRTGGAVGIRQVVEWANGKRGWKAKSVPEAYASLPQIMGGEELDEEEKIGTGGCDDGYCGI